MIILQRRTRTDWVNVERFCDPAFAQIAIERRISMLAWSHLRTHHPPEDQPRNQWEASVWKRARAAWRLVEVSLPQLHPRWNVPDLFTAVPDRSNGKADGLRRSFPRTAEGLQNAIAYAYHQEAQTGEPWRVYLVRGRTESWTSKWTSRRAA